ncbi:histidine kinase [Ornithinimicrobium sp. Y1694]|uniref:histidine kinase n=1 Tax=Ornithinimicrobium sp. Y1694 TaxID=3418590 RepID=UPI003CF8A157
MRQTAQREQRPVRPGRPLRTIGFTIVAFVCDLVLSGVGLGEMHAYDGSVLPTWVLVAAVAVLASPLLLRRRYPLPVLIIVVALTAAIPFVVFEAQPFVSPMVALSAAARWLPSPLARLALAIGLITVVTNLVSVYRFTPDPTPISMLFPGAFFTGAVLMVWSIARRERQHAKRAEELRTQLDTQAEEVARAERSRISRELHDIVAHSVSAMMMQAAGARATARTVADSGPQDERLGWVVDSLSSIEATGEQSMRELHRLLETLRGDEASTDEGDASQNGHRQASFGPGLDALDSLLDTPRRSGLIVDLHRSGHIGELDPSVGAAAYRVVQESLTNALKHGGRGTVVDVYESWVDEGVQVQVRSRPGHEARSDGPATPNGGTGLRGLRERVELAGGRFESGWEGDEFVTTALLPSRPDRKTS